MGFKKHSWSELRYLRNGTKLRMEVIDDSKRKLDTFVSKTPEQHRNVSRILLNKYGINLNPTISMKNSINNLKKEKGKTEFIQKDIEW